MISTLVLDPAASPFDGGYQNVVVSVSVVW
jgi:hypothetical protein